MSYHNKFLHVLSNFTSPLEIFPTQSNFPAYVRIIASEYKFGCSVGSELLYFQKEHSQSHTNSFLEMQLSTSEFLLPNINYCQSLSTRHNPSNQNRNLSHSSPSADLGKNAVKHHVDACTSSASTSNHVLVHVDHQRISRTETEIFFLVGEREMITVIQALHASSRAFFRFSFVPAKIISAPSYIHNELDRAHHLLLGASTTTLPTPSNSRSSLHCEYSSVSTVVLIGSFLHS